MELSLLQGETWPLGRCQFHSKMNPLGAKFHTFKPVGVGLFRTVGNLVGTAVYRIIAHQLQHQRPVSQTHRFTARKVVLIGLYWIFN